MLEDPLIHRLIALHRREGQSAVGDDRVDRGRILHVLLGHFFRAGDHFRIARPAPDRLHVLVGPSAEEAVRAVAWVGRAVGRRSAKELDFLRPEALTN